ncbi:MAG: SAM-dependent methyltransferase [Campylobacterota bacterium]|nr:SAM-dependent methyltransferase [Campylobacterota bacterium]
MKSSITFSEYFHNWLYGEDGYYANYKVIGKGGDFYTAVSSSRFFGGSIGKRVVDVIKEGFLPNDTTIVEIGAHHGYLIADMVEFIYTLKPELLRTLKFAIVERYEHLQIKQKEYFQKCFGDEVQIIHYNDISEVKLQSAFVVANEIFDAFSCDLVYTNENNTLQYAIVEKDKIEFVDINNDKESLNKHCSKYNITKGEVSVGYEEFALNMCKNIEKFEFVTFDYGEQYPRNDFSCRIYEKHNVYPIFDEDIELKKLFGKSDITYDVNFSHLIDSFKKAGAKHLIYQTQLKALVEFGIIELLEILHKNVDEKTYLSEANKVKTLLNPTGMGDRFKMASFRKEQD